MPVWKSILHRYHRRGRRPESLLGLFSAFPIKSRVQVGRVAGEGCKLGDSRIDPFTQLHWDWWRRRWSVNRNWSRFWLIGGDTGLRPSRSNAFFNWEPRNGRIVLSNLIRANLCFCFVAPICTWITVLWFVNSVLAFLRSTVPRTSY